MPPALLTKLGSCFAADWLRSDSANNPKHPHYILRIRVAAGHLEHQRPTSTSTACIPLDIVNGTDSSSSTPSWPSCTYVPDRTQRWFRCILAGQIPPEAPHKLRTPSLAQSGRRTRRRRKSSWGARVRRPAGYGRRFPPCLPSPRRSYDDINDTMSIYIVHAYE